MWQWAARCSQCQGDRKWFTSSGFWTWLWKWSVSMAVCCAAFCKWPQGGTIWLDGSWVYEPKQLQLCPLCNAACICWWLAHDPGGDADWELHFCWTLHVWHDRVHCFHWASPSLPQDCSLVIISKVSVSDCISLFLSSLLATGQQQLRSGVFVILICWSFLSTLAGT